ncbi:MAG: response regulator [Xenococcaceae cyanobacterium MO_188.B29]|nr:response regulator [Xenococcaceae cyanobacterium MO_188.B29]
MAQQFTTGRNIYLPPTELLEQLSGSQANGCLQVSYNSISYLIYLTQGKLTYATNSLEPFERIERHLRRLNHEIPALTRELRTQVRLQFESSWHNDSILKSDYQAICWLVEQNYLKLAEAEILIERLTREVLESYLLIPKIESEITVSQSNLSPIICSFAWQPFIKNCQERLQAWKRLSPHVWSSFQRPYFFAQSHAQRRISSEQQEKLGKVLKGFSFCQLSALFNEDELQLAQKLYPLIVKGIIFLRKPYPPFDRLPQISNINSLAITKAEPIPPADTRIALARIPNSPKVEKTWKIACVDDSPAVLRKIERFLDNDAFSVSLIQDPVKALVQILKIKPDLILLDIGMPNLDGYQLCSLLRNHALFKLTPIVIVTGKEGFIDRAKARLVGATDYITKPFTQSELLKIAFRYLT